LLVADCGRDAVGSIGLRAYRRQNQIFVSKIDFYKCDGVAVRQNYAGEFVGVELEL
jgi:hypothetical protein